MSFHIYQTNQALTEDLKDLMECVPSIFCYRAETFTSTVITHTNIFFPDARYVCLSKQEKVVIYFLEGEGVLSVTGEDVSSGDAPRCTSYLIRGEHAELKPNFPCMITMKCTKNNNKVVVVKEDLI
ncbi:ORF-6 [Teiidae poxvirus 1]|nr:ORF-6 [Teiidae poxvirus 1]